MHETAAQIVGVQRQEDSFKKVISFNCLIILFNSLFLLNKFISFTVYKLKMEMKFFRNNKWREIPKLSSTSLPTKTQSDLSHPSQTKMQWTSSMASKTNRTKVKILEIPFQDIVELTEESKLIISSVWLMLKQEEELKIVSKRSQLIRVTHWEQPNNLCQNIRDLNKMLIIIEEIIYF